MIYRQNDMDEIPYKNEQFNSLERKYTWYYISFVIVGFVILFLLTFVFLTNPPKSFPSDQPINIEKGLSASEISELMAEAKVVRSANILYTALVLLHDPSDIKAGVYVFREPANVFEVAYRLSEDVPQATLVTLTLPEGFAVKEYATIANEKLADFSKEEFIAKATAEEGYLFPDTYFVPTEFTTDELITMLKDAYLQKTEEIREKLESHPTLSEEEIVILASIVEREANTEESMRLVAGILLNRIRIGMPLQADASIEYILDKPLKELTPEDLEIDTPYNTYLYRGLPPTPIGNPGLIALKAVLNPEVTNYFYYITDADGVFHYARTLDEHNQNINRYLR